MKSCAKIWAAVLLAVVLLWICPAVSAAESTGDTVQARAFGEGVPVESATEMDYFDDLKAEKRIRDTLFVTGSALVLIGAAGFLCMLIWKLAHKRRDRVQETREGILNEIEKAEQRLGKIPAKKPRRLRGHKEPVEEVKEPEIVETAPIQLVQEGPIVPSTPVSMQPVDKPRVRPQNVVMLQPAVTPAPTPAPISTPVSASTPTPTPVPASAPAPVPADEEKKDKYDVDEILREIREGKL